MGIAHALSNAAAQAAAPQDAAAAPRLLAGRIMETVAQDRYAVAFAGAPEPVAEASVGVLLPALVPGDEVLLALRPSGEAVITAVLAPSPAVPWSQRAIRLQSQDSVTLSCGEATLRLTAQGLARLVALTIEHDARDLVDIDAAEVRIN
ncbi:hypothetical protein [Paracidovorax anthurii]|uniref:Uncharacterized protein n=1 Tax=Paracidovorax anthurii TaxID=78229 RepID=A0A328YFZ2_9BURK|nr:hypothetical protein [Paracidovorax anthurii]RAR71615.1 hypothetical protein AX018_10902 [Paracidovorax anthurii]